MKIEQEKLEKLARKGPKPGDQQSPDKSTATDSKPIGSSTGSVSSDKNRNYAVVAGALTLASALGWYLLSKPKKSEEVSS
ncbi:hypothetical protein HPP92_003219 [Vanilla planifolia]|uniref:Uncharacterized protein n=1 Tax=Vanilla planifolia TaxID=51239 RepID=A0A835S709_VANPL|nr:hypothetical protein HPP92_003219 [Vanilla planifolia]